MGNMHVCVRACVCVYVCVCGMQSREMGDKDLAAIQRDCGGGLDLVGWGCWIPRVWEVTWAGLGGEQEGGSKCLAGEIGWLMVGIL